VTLSFWMGRPSFASTACNAAMAQDEQQVSLHRSMYVTRSHRHGLLHCWMLCGATWWML
jgi:hypothetical protein